MKYVFKRSCHGHVMPFSMVQPKQVAGKVPTRVLGMQTILLFSLFHIQNGGI